MLRRVWTILCETVNEWLEDNATRLSAALAVACSQARQDDILVVEIVRFRGRPSQ